MDKIRKFKKSYHSMPVVARASLWFVICGFMTRGVSVLTTPIFTRLLSPDQYGTYSVFNSWLEIITILTSLKLGHGVYVQGIVKYSEDQDVFSSSLLGLATTWCGVSFIIYYVFRDFINPLLKLTTPLMICMFVMIVSTTALDYWTARKRNEFKYLSVIKVTVLIVLLKPFMGILAVVMADDAHKVFARILTLAAVELAAGAILYGQIIRRGKCFYNKKYWTYALLFNLPLVPHFISQVILNHSDRIMIQRMVGDTEAGIYSLAYSMAMILSMVNTSIRQALRPWIYQRMKAGETNRIQNVSVTAIIIVAALNLILISFSPELVSLFAPKTYSGTVYLMPPITLAVLFVFLYNLFVDVEMYYEKTRSVMYVAIICAALNIITNYFFLRLFGYTAAAYTTLGCYILMAILHFLSMNRMLRKNGVKERIYDYKTIIAISSVYVAAGTVMGTLYEYFVIRIAVITVFIIGLWLHREQFADILNIMKKKEK